MKDISPIFPQTPHIEPPSIKKHLCVITPLVLLTLATLAAGLYLASPLILQGFKGLHTVNLILVSCGISSLAVGVISGLIIGLYSCTIYRKKAVVDPIEPTSSQSKRPSGIQTEEFPSPPGMPPLICDTSAYTNDDSLEQERATQEIDPTLDVELFVNFTLKQLQDPQFPWDAFLRKDGIGLSLRNHKDAQKIVALTHLPWDILITRPAEIAALLNPSFDDYLITFNLVRALPYSVVLQLAPLQEFSASFLNEIDSVYIQKPDFPIITFLKKEGIGSALRINRYTPELITREDLPWEILAERPKEVRSLFYKPSDLRDTQTQEIIRALPGRLIPKFAAEIPVDFILDFKLGQLKDPLFPWAAFFSKEGIGSLLRRHRHIKEIASMGEIAWSEFPESEMGYLVHMQSERNIAISILGALCIEALVAFTRFSTFSPAHIHYLALGQMQPKAQTEAQDQEKVLLFWNAILSKNNIGSTLRIHPNILTIAAMEDLPWDKLSDHDIKYLFFIPNKPTERKITISILRALPTKALITLTQSPEFSADHVEHITLTQMKKPDFPWKTVVSKKGIGASLRKHLLVEKIVALPQIPWENLSNQETENLFFIHHTSEHEKTKKLIQALPDREKVKLSAKHLALIN